MGIFLGQFKIQPRHLFLQASRLAFNAGPRNKGRSAVCGASRLILSSTFFALAKG